MYIKIYFGDKPLFLCDALTPEIEAYRHHEDTVLVDEFSTPAVHTMIHEMEQEKIHAGIFIHPDLEALKQAVFKKFTLIKAAGGLVFNEQEEALFIFRHGKWDLPKGKLDEGESLETCASREVGEETALRNIRVQGLILVTRHTYHEKGRHILKETHWYRMGASGAQQLVPQTEEDITALKWATRAAWPPLMENSYPSVRDVLNEA